MVEPECTANPGYCVGLIGQTFDAGSFTDAYYEKGEDPDTSREKMLDMGDGHKLRFSYDVLDLTTSALWTDMSVDGTSVVNAVHQWLAAGPSEDAVRYVDTCSGPSCNPTCLDKATLDMVIRHDDASRTLLAIGLLLVAGTILGWATILYGCIHVKRLKKLSEIYKTPEEGSSSRHGNEGPERGRHGTTAAAEKMHIHILNASYKVQIKQKAASRTSGGSATGTHEKTIINGVSLQLKDGVCAIMGPSGSGKTTMLDMIAGRLVGGTVSGYIRIGPSISVYDGSKWKQQVKAVSGYVMQHETPWEDVLSLRENLRFSAELRLGHLSPAKRAQRVEETIADLGMQKFADTKVGGAAGGGGLSGGQKRKLTVAIQLLNQPSILLLDEPTSGLDATSALQFLRVCKDIARRGRIVIMTIHQPRIEVWQQFDRVLLLAKGSAAYFGPPDHAIDYMTTLLYSDAIKTKALEDAINPADAMLDQLNDDGAIDFATSVYSSLPVVKGQVRKITAKIQEFESNVRSVASTAGIGDAGINTPVVGGFLHSVQKMLALQSRLNAICTSYIVQVYTMPLIFSFFLGYTCSGGGGGLAMQAFFLFTGVTTQYATSWVVALCISPVQSAVSVLARGNVTDQVCSTIQMMKYCECRLN